LDVGKDIMRVKTCTACEIILVSTQDEHPCYPEVATVQELNEVMGYARSAYSYWISRIAEDVRYMLEVWDQASLLGDKANAHLARAKATKDEVIRRSEGPGRAHHRAQAQPQDREGAGPYRPRPLGAQHQLGQLAGQDRPPCLRLVGWPGPTLGPGLFLCPERRRMTNNKVAIVLIAAFLVGLFAPWNLLPWN
jgi:hypothetical protein